MRYKIFTAVSVLLMITALYSCREKSQAFKVPLHYGYQPETPGLTRYYNVDTMMWGRTVEDTGLVTTSWQVKEEVIESFQDKLGRTAYRVDVFTRRTSSDPWVIDDVTYFVNSGRVGEYTEDNLQYIRMTYPPTVGQDWDGTALITDINSVAGIFLPACYQDLSFLKDWDYTYTSIHQPETIGGMEFDSICVIEQKGDSNVFAYAHGLEKFAKNIGLVEKHFYTYSAQDGIGLPWYDRVDCGYEVHKIIYDYEE